MACAMALAACKKETNKDKDYISAEIDGVAFYMDNTDSNGLASSTSQCGFIGAKPTLEKRLFIIIHNIDHTTIDLYVDSGYTGQGTYPMNLGNNYARYGIGGGVWSCRSTYPASSGTLEVTSVTNHSIEGTFNFTGECSLDCESGTIKHITNGKFKMPLLHY